MLGASEVLVPRNVALSARSKGALVACDLWVTGSENIREADSGARWRGTRDGFRRCVLLPDVEHFHVELLERCSSRHVAHDEVVTPIFLAAKIQAADAYLSCAERVESSRHGITDACLAHGIHFLESRITSKVYDAVEGNVKWHGPPASLWWNPCYVLVCSLLFDTDAAGVVSWQRSTMSGLWIGVHFALRSPWVGTDAPFLRFSDLGGDGGGCLGGA